MEGDNSGLRLLGQIRSLLADLLDRSRAIWICLSNQRGELVCSVSSEADFLGESEFFSMEYSPGDEPINARIRILGPKDRCV